jgi:rare lipoprotein A
MLVRSSAAICGAVILFAVSSTAAMALTHTRSGHSVGAVKVATATTGDAIVGAASTYNPFKPGWREGGAETATGERYNPSAWTAAIQTGLREKFGSVRQGSAPHYALVEGRGKKAIVEINDVGPLTPGRIIDFSERTMRYFDPSLQLGVIKNVKVTPVAGSSWTPGPIAER